MFTRQYGIISTAIFWGSIVLVGCGTNRHPVTGAPHNQSRTVNPSPPITPSSRPVSSSPSSPSSPLPSSPSTALPSALPSWSSNTHAESAILYTHQQQSFIMQAAQSIGLPAVAVPMRGFGSQYQYTQRILMSGGGSMLVIQYSNFKCSGVYQANTDRSPGLKDGAPHDIGFFAYRDVESTRSRKWGRAAFNFS